MASESTRISIKLLIDQERNKVILVEAGNDFVDTLGSILIVENLNTNIFRTHACKFMLLYPRTIHENKLKKMKLNMDVTEPTKTFMCENLMNRDVPGREMDVVKDETKGESMFFTTDGLVVMKGLPGNLIQFLHKLGIKNFHQIKEEVLEIDSYEMSNLLSYSLVSKTTLTDALLRKQRILSGEKSLLVAPNMEETVEIDVKTRVKIILRKSNRKILFAETSEDFVDLLFSFLTIPFDSVLELLLVRFSSFLDPKSPNPNSPFSSGYVLKNSSFLVTDDLVVKSLSSVSIISVLKELNIPLVDVEQQVISIGQVEALALLKACLCSSSPLSALKNYIVKKRKREPLQ
uniref:DUF674 family protein n=1 Tax=Gossypium raimondii TaxID=29730 RepID=A0A0D2MG71_GOSRA|nr:hypothetical protein B456_002G260100 [Gossypium raimondii]